MCDIEARLPKSSDMLEITLVERFNKAFQPGIHDISDKKRLFLLLCSEMPRESLHDLYQFCDEVYDNVKSKYTSWP